MGSHTSSRESLTCDEDHGDMCLAEHSVSATYHRSTDMVTLDRDGQTMVMPRSLFLQLNVCIAEMLASGGMR